MEPLALVQYEIPRQKGTFIQMRNRSHWIFIQKPNGHQPTYKITSCAIHVRALLERSYEVLFYGDLQSI
jgi:hypothetical protein